MMTDWSKRRKMRFRGEVLTFLSNRHASQKARMDDLMLHQALQAIGHHDVELRDVVTICQEMKIRNWITFEDSRDPLTERVQLYRIAIWPEGQEIVDRGIDTDTVSFS